MESTKKVGLTNLIIAEAVANALLIAEVKAVLATGPSAQIPLLKSTWNCLSWDRRRPACSGIELKSRRVACGPRGGNPYVK